MTADERQAKLLRHEADCYRKALIALYCDATSGKRTTVDKADIARVTEQAIEQGADLFRRAKFFAMHPEEAA